MFNMLNMCTIRYAFVDKS